MRGVIATVLVLALATPAAADPTCSLPPGACEEPVVMRRPQPLWQPLSVLGGGVVVVGLGGLLQLKASADMQAYNDAVATQCAEGGCDPDDIPSHVTDLEDQAILENRLAVTAFVVGAVAVIGGLVWTLLDYPRPVRVGLTGDTAMAEVRF